METARGFSRVLEPYAAFMCMFILSESITCQNVKVTLDLPIKGLSCDKGMRVGDTLLMSGTLHGSGQGTGSDWTAFQFVYRPPKAPSFSSLCTVQLQSCSSTRQRSTGCSCVIHSPDKFYAYLNLSAELAFSNARVKIVWRKTTRPVDEEESAEGSIPTIYDKNSTVLTLIANDKPVNMKVRLCRLPVSYDSYTFRYCCTNAPSPCNLKIASDVSVITGSACVNSTMRAQRQEVFTFSVSLCDKTFQLAGWYCKAMIHRASPPSCGLVCVLVVFVCSSGVVIGVISYVKFKKGVPGDTECQVVMKSADTLEDLAEKIAETLPLDAPSFTFRGTDQNKTTKLADLMDGTIISTKVNVTVQIHRKQNGPDACEITSISAALPTHDTGDEDTRRRGRSLPTIRPSTERGSSLTGSRTDPPVRGLSAINAHLASRSLADQMVDRAADGSGSGTTIVSKLEAGSVAGSVPASAVRSQIHH